MQAYHVGIDACIAVFAVSLLQHVVSCRHQRCGLKGGHRNALMTCLSTPFSRPAHRHKLIGRSNQCATRQLPSIAGQTCISWAALPRCCVAPTRQPSALPAHTHNKRALLQALSQRRHTPDAVNQASHSALCPSAAAWPCHRAAHRGCRIAKAPLRCLGRPQSRARWQCNTCRAERITATASFSAVAQ